MIYRSLLSTVLLMLCFTSCDELSGENDIKSNRYSSFSAASKTDIFESGWLPRALPRSATNIVEVHNIDTSEMWITFRYANNDIQDLTKGCATSPKAQFPSARRIKRNAVQWPKELTDGSDEQSRKRWTILSCSNMQHAKSAYDANVAVDAVSRTVWYWMAQ